MEGGMAMRGSQKLLALVAAGALTLGAAVALAAPDTSKAAEATKPSATQAEKKAEFHRVVRGEVTAVEPGAKTMVVKAMEGKKALDVGVDLTDKTIIRQGKANKTLEDIKVGDRVWMKYEKANDKLVADFVRILKPAKMAAQSKSY
jgi:Cu/Ag efflux protein CusF